jgi:hypothetical protein
MKNAVFEQLGLLHAAPAPSQPPKYEKETGTLNAWGGIREMSLDEPQPGQVGLMSVVSRSAQFSPLYKHEPSCRYLTSGISC